MKKVLRFLSVCLCSILCFCVFSSCNPFKELEKASKSLSCYNITAKINEDDMTIIATEKVKVVNNTTVALSSVCFNLYGRAFREEATVKPYTSLNQGKCFPNGESYGDMLINNVNINGQEKPFEYVGVDENAVEIKLDNELEPQDSVIIELDFTLALAECTHRLGFLNGSINLGNWFPILAVFEKGEYNLTPYYSTGDPFYSEVANYNVELAYPSKYLLSSTGVVEKTTEIENIVTNKLSALAVRDFAIFLTAEQENKTTKVDDVSIKYVGYKDDTDIDFALNTAKKAVKYFSKTFGKYPYKKLDVIKAPFLHGGMEYPSAVIISDSITGQTDIAKVIVHEIAHQWWYAVVGNNEINEAWLDESLAEYSTTLFFENHAEYDLTYEELVSEAFSNYVLYADIVASTNKAINTSMLLAVNEYISEYEYSYMIYVRGVLMFDSLRQVIGVNAIENGFKKYYSKYKFKIAKTDDFIVSMKKASGKSVESVMESWLQGKTVIGTI